MSNVGIVYSSQKEKIRKELLLYVDYEKQEFMNGNIDEFRYSRLMDIVTYTLYLMDTKKPLYVHQKGLFIDEAI